jgi:hypothetical protein
MALNFLLKRTATASKRPVAASMAFGELDVNYDSTTGGVFYKDSANVVTKIGPVEVGTTAPNATPAGSAGNSRGEQWLDTTNGILKTYNGTAFVNPVPNGSTTVVGILQLTDSTSSTSTTTAATPNSVKTAYDLANAAVPKACYTALGALAAGTGSAAVGTLSIGTTGQVLAANTGCATGLQWCTLSLACVPCSAFTGSGQLLTGTGTSTFTALPTGTNGQILAVDTACTGGLKWVTCEGVGLVGYTQTATPFNTALGANAGNSLTSGTNNVSIGHDAGTQISTGTNNVFIGFQAGDSTTTGGNNIAIGAQAMCVATAAVNNIAIGFAALGFGTAGSGNTAVGLAAGANVTTGINNTLIAQNAGDAITTGSCNIAIGFNALTTATTACNSVAIGNNALALATGATNIAVGIGAGCAVTTGTTNLLVGNTAGDAITTGSNNTIIGDIAGSTTLANNLILAAGTTVKLQVNENGAVGVGTTPSYGTTGQTLQSAGTAAPPTWITGASGSFTSQDGKTITVTNGLITAIV